MRAPEPASAYSQFVQVKLPSPRSRTSAIWDGQSAYIFGGKIAKQGTTIGTTQIVRFTPSRDIFGRLSGTVSVVAHLPPPPGGVGGRWDTAAIWDGQNAYIFGGFDDSRANVDEIVRFNPATNDVRVVARLPAPTSGASAVWTGREAYVFGGYTGTSSSPSNQIVRFTPGETAATRVDRGLLFGHNHASAVWQGGSAYLYGGHLGQQDTDAIIKFDPLAFAPVHAGALPGGPRHDTSAILSGDVAYVFGGNKSDLDDNPTDEVITHDPQAGTTRITDRLPRPLAYTSAVGVGRGGFIFGGEIGGGGDPVLSDEILAFTPPLRYVALGDSFSSGEGLGEDDDHPPYFAPPGDPNANPECHRHLGAYPGLFRFPGFLPTQLDFLACTGAETKNIYKVPQAKKGETRTQLDRPEVNPRTEMVTLTIGGNDMGFSKVLVKCAFAPLCHFLIRRGVERDLKKLRPRLNATIDQIQAKTGSRATIFLLGYPHLFPSSFIRQECRKLQSPRFLPGPRIGFSHGEQNFLRRMVRRVRDLQARVAAKQGIFFVDVIGTKKRPGIFTGHEICGPKDDWINAVTGFKPPKFKRGPGSFHPKFAGQVGYVQALASFIYRRIAVGKPRQPSGLPVNPPPKR